MNGNRCRQTQTSQLEVIKANETMRVTEPKCCQKTRLARSEAEANRSMIGSIEPREGAVSVNRD